MNRIKSTHRVSGALLGTQRRGMAAMLVVLITTLMLGGSFVALSTIQGATFRATEARDNARAVEVANACASGALMTLPGLLETMLQVAALEEELDVPADQRTALEMYGEQFEDDDAYATDSDQAADFFGPNPFGDTNQTPRCLIEVVSVETEPAPPGWSEGAGCFKRATLSVEGVVFVPDAVNPRDQFETSRSITVVGRFGPVQCQ